MSERLKFNRIQITLNIDPLFYEILELFQKKYKLRSRGFTFDYIVHTHPETLEMLDMARVKMWEKKNKKSRKKAEKSNQERE
jgi:hypothetical protein